MTTAPRPTDSARKRRWHRFALAFVIGGLAVSFRLNDRALAAELRTSNPYEIIAAYLHRFPAYVSWPTNAVTATNAAWCVGVLGTDPFGLSLEPMLLGESRAVAGHPFEIRHAAELADLPPCHLVFIKFKDDAQLKAALDSLAGQPVLTVGDADNFLKLGGIIQLQRWHNTIRMNINLDAARAANLKIPASMLELANQVVLNGQTSRPAKQIKPTPPEENP